MKITTAPLLLAVSLLAFAFCSSAREAHGRGPREETQLPKPPQPAGLQDKKR